MRELNVNEIKEVNGSGAQCSALTFSTTVMGGVIGAIGGGILSVGIGAGWGALGGASFGQQMGLALCGAWKLR